MRLITTLIIIATFVLTACYAPQFVPCAIHCGVASACPDGLTCGNDLHCHDADDTKLCAQDFLVKVEKAGSGTGVVKGDLGIDCGGTCTTTATKGAAVGLSATAKQGSRFASWSGACAGTAACQLTVSSDQNVTATFVQTNAVDLSFTGPGAGRVFSTPNGLDCAWDCSADFDTSTMMRLTPVPDAVSVFAGWDQGPCSGMGDCMFNLTIDTPVTANFNLL